MISTIIQARDALERAVAALRAPKELRTAPKETTFIERAVRTQIDWNPRAIRSAEALADAGHLSQAATLCEAMLGDDRVQGCLQEARIRGLLGLPITFEPGMGRKRNAAVRTLDAEEDWWTIFPEPALVELLTWGILLGIGIGRLQWTRDGESGRDVPVLDIIHPECLAYAEHKSTPGHKRWLARQANGDDVLVEPGDGTWVVFAPYGMKRPWARGLWRALSRWWLLKRYALHDWARYSERNGLGMLVGVAPAGSSERDRQELASDLESLGAETAIALPPGYDLKMVEAVANTWQTFQSQIGMADTAIAIAAVGQNLTTQVEGGSYAAATVHKSVKNSILKADASSLATVAHDQVLRSWARFNFGSEAAAPWPTYHTDPPEDLKAKADQMLGGATAVQAWISLGVPVERMESAKVFGVLIDPNKPLEEVQPPKEGGKGSEKDDEGDTSNGAENRRKKDQTKMLLSSGMPIEDAKGFIEGQAYADGLAAEAAAIGSAEMADTLEALDAVIDSIEEGPDWSDRLREALLAFYEQTNPSRLRNTVEKAGVLAFLGGRTAAAEDA